MTYSDKLKHPKWQKKRLEIMQRDNFACRACFDHEGTLHVHHIIYNTLLEPWEYKEIDLITLCKDCHEVWHFIYDKCKYDPELISLVTNLYNKLEFRK